MASRPVPAEGSSTTVGRRDGGRRQRRKAERDRRRELLEAPGFPRTGACASAEARRSSSARKAVKPESGFAEKRLAVFAQEKDGRDFAGLIGGLPVPGARRRRMRRRRLPWRGAGCAASIRWPRSRWGSRRLAAAKTAAVEGPTPGRAEAARPKRSATGDEDVHGRNLGRAGTDEPARRSLSSRPDSSRPGRPLPLER